MTATEIKQVQPFCTIYIYAFIIIINKHGHRYRNPLQPMLRSPITTGVLSLISIFTAFQKVPNLFSFMLHSATRRNFSPFNNTSLSFPPLKKRKKGLTPTFLSYLTNMCDMCESLWQEADSVPHHEPVLFCCLVCLCLPALIPVIQVLEEVCAMVLNTLECKSCGLLASGMREHRGKGYCWIFGFGFPWLLFKKEMKHEKP